MINELSETMNQKTISQYKVIEEKYEILKRYLRLSIKKHNIMTNEDIELILMVLSDIPICELEDLIGERTVEAGK